MPPPIVRSAVRVIGEAFRSAHRVPRGYASPPDGDGQNDEMLI